MKRILPIIFFILVCAIIFILNWQPDTFLSGGDNLHPEFSFGFNFKRSIFAVWQEYQGLGLLGGMGHAADLVHQFTLYISSFITPLSGLRYLWTFLMLMTGSVGAYYLTRRLLPKNNYHPILPFIGGIFYLFNLATVQAFYTPFEVFTAHFAFLPWLLLTFINVFFNPRRKNLLLFILTLILATPAAYVPTLFVTYLLSIGILFCALCLFIRKKSIFFNGVRAFLLVILVNSFWLLPFLYFTLTNSQVNLNAVINQISTEEIFLKNKEFGHAQDVMLLKGFWFNNVEPDSQGNYVYMLANWRDHLANPWITSLGYFLFGVILVGILTAFIKRKPLLRAFAILFIFSFTMLVISTPPFSWIDNLFRQIPLFDQAFRFAFTKFSILTALTYAIFFTIGLQTILGYFKNKKLVILGSLLAIEAVIIFTLPILEGHLFYDRERVSIPNEYFQLADFFKKENPNTRIANFPQHTFWSWNFYQWGYSGSGFLWYGIEQPILDRAFDPWSSQNENYYWEASYAVYSKNLNLLENVLEKYQINWILIDENIINPSAPKALFNDELESMLAGYDKVSLVQTLGKLKVYQVNLNTPVKNYLYLGQNLPNVGPTYKWNNYDQAFIDNGHYVSDSNIQALSSNLYYPFRSLFTGKRQMDREFTVEDHGDYFLFKKTLPQGFENYFLDVSKINPQDLMWVDPNDLSISHSLLQDVYFDGRQISIRVPKVTGYFSAEINPVNEVGEAKNCNNKPGGSVENEIIDGVMRLTAQDANNCSAAFYLPNLPHNLSYLISVDSRHVAGKTLLFWLENLNSRRSDLESYLPTTNDQRPTTSYFIQPPMESDGLGYTIHLDNISIGRDKSVNDLGKITVNPIPYKFLTSLVLLPSNNLIAPEGALSGPQPMSLSPVNSSHPNPSMYEVDMTGKSGPEGAPSRGTLVLSQSYNAGWKAYQCLMSNDQCQILPMIFGKEIKDHVLINNWSNGWVINPNITHNSELITIIFLPQYLEYLGFILLAGTILWLILIPPHFLWHVVVQSLRHFQD
ncbi:hypothetical protein HY404_00485 [Candidatus Microgenomates bacterium]|nr:hypothetical protein [Candidatus Microgenomates bacterium]